MQVPVDDSVLSFCSSSSIISVTVSSTSVGVFTIAFLLKFTDACAVSTLSALFATAGVAERSENSDSTADLSWEVQFRLLTTLLVAAEEVGQAINELSRELSTNQFAPLSHRVLK